MMNAWTYRVMVWVVMLCMTSCLPSSQGRPFDDMDVDADDASTDMALDEAMDMPPSPCIPEEDDLRQPRSITQAMALIEVLPKPLTIPCFITALDRPMSIHATRGEISAQPAHGARSPRIFIFLEPLIMSIATEGEGSYLLEFGELDGQGNSIKGEVSFPVTGLLADSEPYAHVIFNERITTCGFCHANERVVFEVDGVRAHTSVALRPVDRERVSIAELRLEHMNCDELLEPRRCEILDALFLSDLSEGYFPKDLPTFY